MSQNRKQLLEQLESLSTSLTAVLGRLGQIQLEVSVSKSEANRQISMIRDFLNSRAIAALAGPDPSAGAEVSRANEALQKLSGGETQEQILEIFLQEVEAFTDRAILFLHKDDSYVPWKSMGFESSILESARVEAEDPISHSAHQQRIVYRTDNLAEAFPWLSTAGDIPTTAVCIPLIFEDTAPVVLFADSAQGIELDALELLSHLVVLVLKNHYLMTRLGSGRTDSPAPFQSVEPGEKSLLTTDWSGLFKKAPESMDETAVVSESVVEPELDEETEKKHQEALRFARLLVSEIKLYHEETVNEGRKNSDIYGVLQRDIDRSREMYERRADPGVKASKDRFHEELIRILAEGHEDRMGAPYPGPRLTDSE